MTDPVYVYTFSAANHADLTFDAYLGEVTTDLSDQDALYWANYLTSLADGIVEAGVYFREAGPGWQNVVGRFSAIASALDVLGTVVETSHAATPRDAVQILSAGLVSTLITINAGYYTGLLAAGLPILFAGPAAPAWVIALAALAVAGVTGYIVAEVVDHVVKASVGEVFGDIYDFGAWVGVLLNIRRDPLVLDLDGDGIELTALAGSNVHFDFDGDGFAERTGWVSSDDGILVRDKNANGVVDGGRELFGSATQDGFAVLETMDTNGDGKIDASDTDFGQLRIWRDLNQNGVADAGEMVTLAAAGIRSISLSTQDVSGTNQGHAIGNGSLYTRTDGGTGIAQTVYFETDRQDTVSDGTPTFEPAEGVMQLPQLPGSGQINSIAWMLTTDSSFKAAWVNLTEGAAELSFDDLKAQFESLLLKWASVDNIVEFSRGQFVNAQHLAFIERYFGTAYAEIYSNEETAASPTTSLLGDNIEASFEQISAVLLTAFLSQISISNVLRGEDFTESISSPYFGYSALKFGGNDPEPAQLELAQESVVAVVKLIVGMQPAYVGDSAQFLMKSMAGLEGVVSTIFGGDRAAYVAAVTDTLEQIDDPNLLQIATAIVSGDAVIGSSVSDGLVALIGDNLFVGGHGDDVMISGEGADLFVYGKQDGSDFIRDSATSVTENDRLLLTDLDADDLTFERIGDHLIIRITETNDTVTSENFFKNWGEENAGIDSIILADGSVLSREDIRELTTTVGDGRGNYIEDTNGDDVIWAGEGNDQIDISEGNDTILYAAGDGNDLINSIYEGTTEKDTLVLTALKPSDVQLSRSGDNLIIKILSTDERVIDEDFFRTTSGGERGWGIDRLQFANGVTWDRQTIQKNAWLRGSENDDSMGGYAGNDIFEGGKGADTLSGGQGSDIYHWKKGDGSDTISESNYSTSNSDRLILENVALGDVRFIRSGTDLLIEITSTGEVIKVQNQFASIGNIINDANTKDYGLEEIQFKNGNVLGRDEFMRKIVNTGLDLEIMVVAYRLDTEGQPTSEMVTISHSDYSSGGTSSSLSLPIGVFFVDELGNEGNYFDPEEIPSGYDVVRNGDDILIGTDDSESIGDGYQILATDPTSSEDDDFHMGGGGGSGLSTPPGLPPVTNVGDNYFNGGLGNDKITGGQGHDVVIGGDGNDVLYGDGSNASDSSSGGFDMLDGGNGNDVLRGGGKNDVLLGGDGTDKLYGGNGDDYLQDGSLGEELFVGGQGNDFIVSAYQTGSANSGAANGNDTFTYQLGDGSDFIFDGSHSTTEIDKLILSGIDSDDVEYTKRGDDLIIRIVSTGEEINNAGVFWNFTTKGQGIDKIYFADGVVRSRESFGQDLIFRGTNSAETLRNNEIYDSRFIAGKGDDIIMSASTRGSSNGGGANGNDTFIYTRGDGNDLFFEGSHSSTEVDKLILTNISSTDVLLSWVGLDLLIKDRQTGSVITNEGFFWSWGTVGQGIDIVEFGDGISWNRTQLMQQAWVRGTETKDALSNTSNVSNTFWGGLGADTITSAAGGDTFMYALGDGNDGITDTSASLSEIDILKLTGINAEDLLLSVVGTDLIISIVTSGQQITDFNAFWGRPTTGRGIDRIEFGNGSAWSREEIRYWAQEGSLFYVGTSSNETLMGSYHDQNLSGGDGNDTVDGGLGSDLVYGGSGSDVLTISVADVGDIDRLDGQAGTDTASFANYNGSVFVDLVLNGGEVRTSDGAVLAGEGDRLIGTTVSIENISGSAFGDSLLGDDAANLISGKDGNDALSGRGGSDSLDGGTGNDILSGGVGIDTLRGGSGDDQLSGDTDNDIYAYAVGDGHDTIIEADAGGTADRIKLEGLLPSQISFARSGSDLLLRVMNVAGTDLLGSITLQGASSTFRHFDQFGIESITFDNGTSWNVDYLRQWSIYATATDGNDTLTGTVASGDFGGGKGNDTLNAAGGNDTYIYARGDGNDTVNEAADYLGTADKLSFTNINSTGVTLARNGNDLTVVVSESSAGAGDGGSVLIKSTLDDYRERGLEAISFADGVTWSRAQMRSLVLSQSATTGNDTIVGFNVADTISGGLGNDSLSGVEGNDTYLYARGDGNDTINEITDYLGTADKLSFTNINSTGVTLVRNGNDLTVVVSESSSGAGDGGSVLIKSTLDDYRERGLESISFADGITWSRAQMRSLVLSQSATTGNDTIVGFNVTDTISGGLGNDSLSGVEGNDTYLYARGDGNDTINEITDYLGTADKLSFTNINSTGVTLLRNGNDLTVVVSESTAGAGDGGSVLIKSTLDDYRERGLESISFADGVTWSRAQMRSLVLSQSATTGNDTIVGFNVTDTISGGLGNDALLGAEGNDTYLYARGDGNDTIDESADYLGTADKLSFTNINSTGVTLVRNGNDLTVVVKESGAGAGDGSSMLIKSTIDSYRERGLESITFADGVTWSRAQMVSNIAYVGGTTGNETITGTTGNDIIMAGAGNDTLVGLAGNDTFVFEAGFGQDIINDFTAGSAVADVIRIKDGLFADYSAVMSAASQVGSDVLITYDVTNSIRLKNVSLANLHLNDFAFG